MLLAVIEDFLALPHCRVLTTWDARLGKFPISHSHLEVTVISDSAVYSQSVDAMRKQSTHSLVIAPEFHGILRGQVAQIGMPNSLNCSVEAIELCADKLRLAEFLQQHGIATIETAPFNWANSQSLKSDWLPIVIKPRDGAGSQCTFRIASPAAITEVNEKFAADLAAYDFIQQPFVAGRALSMGVVIPGEQREMQLLPLCEQILSEDSRFQFLGSRAGVFQRTKLEAAAFELVRRCCELLPGLRGYVGFDLIEPTDRPGEVVLVEINPRVTTSYLAYRQLVSGNLAAALLGLSSVNCCDACIEYQVADSAV